MCHSIQFKYAQVSKDSFDFKPVFRKVKPIIEKADLAIGNLETTTAGAGRAYSGYPAFNSPDAFVEALGYTGFDLLITANNHALDTGMKGATRSTKIISQNGMNYNGTFFSKEDSDSVRIYSVNGLDVAIFSYTYGTNTNFKNNTEFPLISYIDTLKIKNDLMKARVLGSDLKILFFHFGNEYQREPSKQQKDIVNYAIQNGADIILASHPHVIQPVEFFKTVGGKLDTGFVAYSLGNFVSNQRWRYSDCGVILNFSVTKQVNGDVLVLSDFNFIPTWVFKGNTGKRNEYIILPIEDLQSDTTLTFLTKEDLSKIEQSRNDTYEIMRKYSEKINSTSFHLPKQ